MRYPHARVGQACRPAIGSGRQSDYGQRFQSDSGNRGDDDQSRTHFSPPRPKAWKRCSPTSCGRWAPRPSSRSAPASTFRGPLEVGYRACLWSRVASRVLLPLASFAAATPAALYGGVRTIRWSEHVGRGRTIAVDCAVSHSQITHSHFAALKTKDAIVDQLREQTGTRPSVAVERPDVRVNVYLHDDRATVSIDLSGDSLHRRGYRQAGGAAPLKENLAAAVLLLADWPRLARERVPLLDPMCGSGTLCIEAALIAADIAPGRGAAVLRLPRLARASRRRCGSELLAEAAQREIRDPKRLPIIRGYDADARAVRSALANVERAGLRGRVHIEKRALADCEPIVVPVAGDVRGLVVTNPPYGERLGDVAALRRSLRAARRHAAADVHRLDRLRAHRQPRSRPPHRPAAEPPARAVQRRHRVPLAGVSDLADAGAARRPGLAAAGGTVRHPVRRATGH